MHICALFGAEYPSQKRLTFAIVVRFYKPQKWLPTSLQSIDMLVDPALKGFWRAAKVYELLRLKKEERAVFGCGFLEFRGVSWLHGCGTLGLALGLLCFGFYVSELLD